MSKVSGAKIAQGYTRAKRDCSRCAHFKSEIVTISDKYGVYSEEKNLRCGIGGFKVHKTATCNKFEPKGE